MKNTRAFTQSDFKRITTVARPVITSMLKKINLSQEDEDDVMSETLIKIVRYWDRYDESVSKDAWFKKIAANCANTYLRKAYKYIENRQSIDKITNDGESYEIDYQSLAVDGQQYCTYADLSLYSKPKVRISLRQSFPGIPANRHGIWECSVLPGMPEIPPKWEPGCYQKPCAGNYSYNFQSIMSCSCNLPQF